jgi:hypothetical protein
MTVQNELEKIRMGHNLHSPGEVEKDHDMSDRIAGLCAGIQIQNLINSKLP